MSKRAKQIVGIAAAAVFVAGLFLLPWSRWTLSLVESVRQTGALGVGLYAVAYVAATVLLLPGSVLTLGAGFVYGPLWGTAIVSPVSVLAAASAFVLGRSVARDWVARRVAGHPRFAAIDRAVGESGFKIVFLLRLSPIVPFNILNYALALTRVRARDYVVASFLGMLPGTFLYVYLGSLVTSASDLASGDRPPVGAWQEIFYWAGLAATVVVTVLITRIARRALDRALDANHDLPAQEIQEVPS